ncbi:AAA family ATPase [Thermodesulfobacteriota bacterium]
MSIIIISSDSYNQGLEIASKVAETMDYTFLGREILNQVAEKYHLPEAKLRKAMDEMPRSFGMFSKLRKRYLAYIQAATLTELQKDNVVCQGLDAHLYVLGVSHVLKVRILSDPTLQAQQMASRMGIPPRKARKLLARNKKLHQRLSLDFFHLDETDPSIYELLISLRRIDQEEAVKIITETVSSQQFKPMTYSNKCMRDLELAGRVRAALLEPFPAVRVSANSGTLVVESIGLLQGRKKIAAAIKEQAQDIPGVEYVEVHFSNGFLRRTSESFY